MSDINKVYTYLFDINTKEYLGKDLADKSPLEVGKYLHPANGTAIEPMSVTAGNVAVFLDGEWVCKVDVRGVDYWLPGDVTKHTVTKIGDTVPKNSLTSEPTVILGAEELVNKMLSEKQLLLSTVVDHYQRLLVWEDLTPINRDKVRQYRRELLSITNDTDPSTLVWPTLGLIQ